MQTNHPNAILSAMEEALGKFSLPAPGELGELYQCLEIACSHLRDMHHAMREHVFADPDSEIEYFKRLQPSIEGRVFFYSQVIAVEQSLPAKAGPQRIEHYQAAWARIDEAFREMGEFYRYHQLGATYLDALYFRRWSHAGVPTDGAFLLSDPALRSAKSLDKAKIVGYKLLEAHLDYRIWFLQQQFSPKSVQVPLRWQLSRAAITELIYALLEVKAFGSDAQDVKRICDYFQQVFHINVANIYATYEDNRLRKKDRTPFLHSLVRALERRMDMDDLNAL